MNRRFFLSLVVLLGFTFLAVGGSAVGESSWQAGFAKAKITPKAGLWMAGYASRDHAAEGTLHDLWLKVLALGDSEGHRAVLISLDLLGLSRPLYDSICARLQRRCGLARADILLSASHTHSGPVLRSALYDIYPLDEDQHARIEEYSSRLEDALVETVVKALDDMHPAQLAVGASSAAFAANRRAVRSGGDAAVAPVDHVVPALSVRSPKGERRVVVFGYACHATTLDIYQWNGDYPGFAQLAIEERFPGAEAMFVAGCGADQNPNPRRSVELCQAHGLELADAVCDALNGPMEPVSPTLKTAIDLIELPYDEQPSEEYLEKTAAGSGYQARWAQRLLRQAQEGQAFADSYPAYPVQVWQLGHCRLVALGGEVVVDYMAALRERLGQNTWVAGYANDVMAYIPSRRVREEGGYEAGAFNVYGLPALSWSADIEDRILDAAEGLVQRLEAAAAH